MIGKVPKSKEMSPRKRRPTPVRGNIGLPKERILGKRGTQSGSDNIEDAWKGCGGGGGGG